MSSRGGGGPPAASDVLGPIFERNQQATIYVGNLDTRANEDVLWEIFTQCGPVKHVHIPRDKVTGAHSGYGFVEFRLENDADYALRILNMVRVYNRPMRCSRAAQDKRTLEIGANLFVGNLDAEVDDALLADTFGVFGSLLSARVMRDAETGEHRGFGFVAFDSFEAADAALAALNGQFLCDRPVHVSYAYKKDADGQRLAERHGSAAERMLASSRAGPRGLGSGPGPRFPPPMGAATRPPPPNALQARMHAAQQRGAILPGLMHAPPLAPQRPPPAPYHQFAAASPVGGLGFHPGGPPGLRPPQFPFQQPPQGPPMYAGRT